MAIIIPTKLKSRLLFGVVHHIYNATRTYYYIIVVSLPKQHTKL